MPNRNYNRGAAFERSLQKAIRESGWVCYRAAGSHGCADLIALKAGMAPALIQCKTGRAKPTPADRKAFQAEVDTAGACGLIAFKRGRKPVEFEPISIPAPDWYNEAVKAGWRMLKKERDNAKTV